MRPMVAGIDINTKNNKPDVKNILSEKREAEHQWKGRDGISVDIHFKKINNDDTHDRCQTGIDQSCADTSDDDIVGDKNIRFYDNGIKTAKHFGKGL